MKIDDELLIAYADGELEDDQYQAVEDALGKDQQLQKRLVALVRAGDIARAAFYTKYDEEIPPHLIAAIYDAKRPNKLAKAEPETPRLRDRMMNWFGTPIPAAGFAGILLLVIGALAGRWFFPNWNDKLLIAEFGPVVGPSALYAQLERSPSGIVTSIGDFRLEIIATFVGDDDRVCREYQAARSEHVHEYLAGVACRRSDRLWEVVFTVSEHFKNGMSSDIYATASDDLHEAIDSFIGLHLGIEPLSEAQERVLIESNWAHVEPE